MSEHTGTLSRRSFIGGAALGVSALMISPTIALAAPTAAEKQAEADAVRNQLVSLQADLETAADNYYAAVDEQQAAQGKMEEAQTRIDSASSQISSLQDKLGYRARSMYRNGSFTFLDLLLGATSFQAFTSNWDLLNDMNQDDATMVQQTKDLKAEVEAQKAEYAAQEQIAAQKAAEAKAIQDDTQAKVDNATALMNQLDAEARQLLEQEQAAAAAALAAAQSAMIQNRNRGGGGGGSSSGGSAASSGGSSSGGGGGSSSGGSASSNDYYDDSEDYYEDSGSSGSSYNDVPSYGSVVDYALSRIGCPYVWGGEGPNEFDCSGLVVWSYRQIGIELPHQSGSLYAVASQRVPVSEARPGDVLWRSGHVGIAVGYGGEPYVHAPTFGAYVRDTDDLSWAGFTCALRF